MGGVVRVSWLDVQRWESILESLFSWFMSELDELLDVCQGRGVLVVILMCNWECPAL